MYYSEKKAYKFEVFYAIKISWAKFYVSEILGEEEIKPPKKKVSLNYYLHKKIEDNFQNST